MSGLVPHLRAWVLAAVLLLNPGCTALSPNADQIMAVEVTGADVYRMAHNAFSTGSYLGSNKDYHFIRIDDRPPGIEGWSKLYKVPRDELQAGKELPFAGPTDPGKRASFKLDPASQAISFSAP